MAPVEIQRVPLKTKSPVKNKEPRKKQETSAKLYNPLKQITTLVKTKTPLTNEWQIKRITNTEMNHKENNSSGTNNDHT